MRCFHCDSDAFKAVMENGEILEADKVQDVSKIVDYQCVWCGHLVSEGNPRDGDPEETVESLKEERDEIRAQLEACMGEDAEAVAELRADKVAHDRAVNALHD